MRERDLEREIERERERMRIGERETKGERETVERVRNEGGRENRREMKERRGASRERTRAVAPMFTLSTPQRGAHGLAVGQAVPGGATRAAPAPSGLVAGHPKEREGRTEKGGGGVDGGDGGDIMVMLMIWVEVEKLGGVEMVEIEFKEVEGGGSGDGDGRLKKKTKLEMVVDGGVVDGVVDVDDRRGGGRTLGGRRGLGQPEVTDGHQGLVEASVVMVAWSGGRKGERYRMEGEVGGGREKDFEREEEK